MTKAEIYKDIFVILITLTFVLSIIKFVYAQPYVPHQFYGEVKCPDGSLVADGTKIVVKAQGAEIKSTLTSSGLYGYSPLFLVWETTQGTPLDFYISEIFYTSVAFNQGASQRLDFVLSSCPSSSGGSGGGGGSTQSSTNSQGSPSPIKSIIFNDNAPINPSPPNPTENPTQIETQNLSNLIAKPLTTQKRQILALDISIIALLILSVMVLIVYTKMRGKSQYAPHQITLQ